MTSLARGLEYWCYQCNRVVTTANREEIICPFCNGGFLEEVENTVPGLDMLLPATLPGMFNNTILESNPLGNAGAMTAGEGASTAIVPAGFRQYQPGQRRNQTYPAGGAPAFLQVLEAMSTVLQQIQQPPEAEEHEGSEGTEVGDGIRTALTGTADAGATTDPSNSVSLWQGQMQNFLGSGGNVEVFFDNGTGTPRRLPGNFGDYFLGPGLDQLIQQLAENDPNRYGAPPASKTSIDAMPTIHISQEHLGTDAAHCAVCKDEFEMGFPVRQMPCKHMYHGECIMPWLSQHNSCPVCRYEMDTDDADYDQTRATAQLNSHPAATSNPYLGPNQPGGGSDAGAGTAGGFTFWDSPAAGFGVSNFLQEAGSENVPNIRIGGSNVAPQLNNPTGAVDPSGVIMSRPRLSFHLPWPFRSSSPQQTSPPNGNAEASASGTASGAIGTPDQDSHSGTTPNPPPEAPPGNQNDDHTTTRLDELD